MQTTEAKSSTVDPHDYLAQLVKDKQLDLLDQKIAAELDEKDELKGFRDRFYFPIVEDESSKINGQEYLYFTGNSLGLQPKTTKKYIEEELDVWRKVNVVDSSLTPYKAGVEGHFKHSKNRPWLTTDEYVLDQMSRIVGAEKDEVVVMNSLTVNLHLMMVNPFIDNLISGSFLQTYQRPLQNPYRSTRFPFRSRNFPIQLNSHIPVCRSMPNQIPRFRSFRRSHSTRSTSWPPHSSNRRHSRMHPIQWRSNRSHSLFWRSILYWPIL